MVVEFLQITQAVAMGFAALGALGYFVKVRKKHLAMMIMMMAVTKREGEERIWTHTHGHDLP